MEVSESSPHPLALALDVAASFPHPFALALALARCLVTSHRPMSAWNFHGRKTPLAETGAEHCCCELPLAQKETNSYSAGHLPRLHLSEKAVSGKASTDSSAHVRSSAAGSAPSADII